MLVVAAVAARHLEGRVAATDGQCVQQQALIIYFVFVFAVAIAVIQAAWVGLQAAADK